MKFSVKKLNATERYILHLADNGLIMNHRLCEWCGQAPDLEIEMSLANIGLDYLGQARLWLNALVERLAAKRVITTEDEIAYLRDADEYTNLLLCEQPNGDYAMTVVKIFFFSEFYHLVFKKLSADSGSKRSDIAAIAAKALLETGYHQKFSRHWMKVMGGGTEESRRRVREAVDYLWPYVGEFFHSSPYEKDFFGEDGFRKIKETWLSEVKAVLRPLAWKGDDALSFSFPSGKEQHHSEYLSHLLVEFQSLHRRHREVKW